MIRRPPNSPLFPYTPLSRSYAPAPDSKTIPAANVPAPPSPKNSSTPGQWLDRQPVRKHLIHLEPVWKTPPPAKALRATNTDSRSEEHTSELQSHLNIVCRLL